MRLVKDGKIYDTGKATKCHEATETELLEELTRQKTLYMTENGAYFLVALNTSGELVEWEVMDEEEASEWLDSVLAPVEAYEKAEIRLEEA